MKAIISSTTLLRAIARLIDRANEHYWAQDQGTNQDAIDALAAAEQKARDDLMVYLYSKKIDDTSAKFGTIVRAPCEPPKGKGRATP